MTEKQGGLGFARPNALICPGAPPALTECRYSGTEINPIRGPTAYSTDKIFIIEKPCLIFRAGVKQFSRI